MSRKPKEVVSLPYNSKLYINGQVLIPAKLIKSLGIEEATYASLKILYKGNEISIERAKLLRTRHTASRQFTVPRDLRVEFKMKPGDT
ncbi:MAG: AbrB/MazE/SpoVT family DNA-binding domain-containing protein, partial [Thermoprotei archaeon]